MSELPATMPAGMLTHADRELVEWRARQKAAYKTRHLAQNRALLDLTQEEQSFAPRQERPGYDASGAMLGSLSELAARLEAENAAAEGLVDDDRENMVATALREGFVARREGLPATDNPHWQKLYGKINYVGTIEHDLFVSWYDGWLKGEIPADWPRADDPGRPRGYTPPTGRVCNLCGQPERARHKRSCAYMGGFALANDKVTRSQCNETVPRETT